MRRGPSIALIALFVLASYDLSIRPQRLIESFRVMRCCVEHCQRPGNMSSAERCCGVAQDAGGLRAVSAVAPDFGGVAAVLLPARVEVFKPTENAVALADEPSRGPPIFLSHLSLLL